LAYEEHGRLEAVLEAIERRARSDSFEEEKATAGEPREEKFLKYNKLNVLTNLLQAEDHARYLGEKYDVAHASCVTKHLLITIGESNEGISHSPSKEEKRIFAEIRNEALRLMEDIGNISRDELIGRIREVRKRAEGLEKGFNLSECRSCEIVSPEKKALYSSPYSINPDRKMAWKETAIVLGTLHASKGITLGTDYVDTWAGKTGAPVQERPSAWINVGVGLGLVLIPRIVRMSSTVDTVLTLVGGFMTTKIWDYVQEYTVAGAPLRAPVRVAPPTPAPTPVAPYARAF
jgi:hypothetical protein